MATTVLHVVVIRLCDCGTLIRDYGSKHTQDMVLKSWMLMRMSMYTYLIIRPFYPSLHTYLKTMCVVVHVYVHVHTKLKLVSSQHE